SATAYHVTFDDTSQTGFRRFFHVSSPSYAFTDTTDTISVANYSVDDQAPEPTYQQPSHSLHLHFTGPCTAWMILPAGECAGHRVLVVAWAKSTGIVHHGAHIEEGK